MSLYKQLLQTYIVFVAMFFLNFSSLTANALTISSSDTLVVNETVFGCSPYMYQSPFTSYPLEEGLNVNSIIVSDTTYIYNVTFISQNSFGIDSIVACDSYTWIDGNTYIF